MEDKALLEALAEGAEEVERFLAAENTRSYHRIKRALHVGSGPVRKPLTQRPFADLKKLLKASS